MRTGKLRGGGGRGRSLKKLRGRVERVLRELEGRGVLYASVQSHSRIAPKMHFIAFNLRGKMVFIRLSPTGATRRGRGLRWMENMLPGKYVLVSGGAVDELRAFLLSELAQ